jgi:transcriptional regulator with XRE-family HTH domain
MNRSLTVLALLIFAHAAVAQSKVHSAIGDDVRTITLGSVREEKEMSQGDIEKKTGLLRCYVSRCEHGHTVPNLGTLEKWAGALDVPLYRLFYDGDKPPKPPTIKWRKQITSSGQDKKLEQLRRLLAKIPAKDQQLLLGLATKFARKTKSKTSG